MNGAEKNKQHIYAALLSVPGMTEKCKVVFQLSRQNILLLSRIIEAGMVAIHESGDAIAGILSKESKQEMDQVVPELLQKAGLAEFYEKLKSF